MKVWVVLNNDEHGWESLEGVFSNEQDAKLLLDKLGDPDEQQYSVTTTDLK